MSLGRFDLKKFVVHCKKCNAISPSWTVTDIVQAGYWPASPTDTSYVFDQQLFQLWYSLQKRMPGTSESSFIRALEDISAINGRVLLTSSFSLLLFLILLRQGASCIGCVNCEPSLICTTVILLLVTGDIHYSCVFSHFIFWCRICGTNLFFNGMFWFDCTTLIEFKGLVPSASLFYWPFQ